MAIGLQDISDLLVFENQFQCAEVSTQELDFDVTSGIESCQLIFLKAFRLWSQSTSEPPSQLNSGAESGKAACWVKYCLIINDVENGD